MTADTGFKNIRVETSDPGVSTVTISRPEVLNALNHRTLVELREALTSLSKDPAVRVVVLTGDGEKSFVAGADIAEMKDKSTAEGVEFARAGQDVTQLLELMPKPTIAAVNGFALGGGTEMAIACDFIVSSDRAVFGQPEVGLGIIPGFGATVRLAKFVGYPMAKDLIFSGRKIKADEALRIGLVNRVFPAAEFRKAAADVAAEISRNSAGAVAVSKSLLNEFSETTGLTYKLDSEAQQFGSLFGSRDQREGMTAFVEKRKPKFEGLQNQE